MATVQLPSAAPRAAPRSSMVRLSLLPPPLARPPPSDPSNRGGPAPELALQPEISGALADHEDQVARQPFALHAWLAYLRALQDPSHPVAATREASAAVFERALAALPRSYKLWKLRLDATYAREVRGQRPDARAFRVLAELYERALAQLPTMPRLWLDYAALLRETRAVTATRRVFDRALRALPVTQHHRVWAPYLAFVREVGVPQTAIQVYRRYLMLEPTKREEFVEYLVSIRHYEEASRQLVALIESLTSSAEAARGTTHRLWMQLCDMVSQHPDRVAATLDVEAILRSGIALFSDEVGRLWCALATYFIRLGMFESARDIYEEGIRSVMTVRDFSMIYDAYVKFIEAMLTAEMDLASGQEQPQGSDDDEEEEDDINHQEQVDRLLKVYEDVADRRPMLLNSVLLRQNPHNVREWEKRVELQKDDAQKVIRTFAEAVKTIDPARSGGRLPALWVQFAKFYESHKDLTNARAIFRKAVAVEYRNAAELAEVQCEWAEMELRHDNFDEALELVRNACAVPETVTFRLRKRQALTASDKLHQNGKLWELRVDLEESLGDVASTRSAYDEAFELKIATPQMILQYAAYLEENKYFEESFRVFERGLSLFPRFPHAAEIWKAYLTKFVARYGGAKMERARDLHEQAIKAAPAKSVKVFYEKYAALEESHGLLRNVMTIYERAADAVLEEERLDVYLAHVKKAQKFFGVAKVREVYARGVANLPDKYVAPLCLKFAAMETKLGEFERARAIYAHAAQFCDPRKHEANFWQVWHAFEVAHGSEHSFLEMLRIKRSVVAQYSQVNYVASGTEGEQASTGVTGMVPANEQPSSAKPTEDPMSALEAQLDDGQPSIIKKRKLERPDGDDEVDRVVRQKQEEVVVHVENEEEIDLDDEDEDEEGDGSVDEIEECAVPSTLLSGK